jgi:beta-glucosidase
MMPAFWLGGGHALGGPRAGDRRGLAGRTGRQGTLVAEVTLRNSGACAGQEVVQLYVRERSPKVVRPERELRAFAKVRPPPADHLPLAGLAGHGV